jgi:hypothetical protein
MTWEVFPGWATVILLRYQSRNSFLKQSQEWVVCFPAHLGVPSQVTRKARLARVRAFAVPGLDAAAHGDSKDATAKTQSAG